MVKQGTRLAAQIVHWGDHVEFYIANYDRGERAIAKPVEFVKDEGGLCVEPAFRLPMEAAQEFFEMLWAQGFRSKHDRGGADRLDAARAEHIADLRKAAKLA